MIIYLYGVDSYRRGVKLKELVARYRAKYKNADFLDVDLGEDADAWEDVRDFLEQPSLFVSSKLAVVRESGEVSLKPWRDLLKSVIDDKNTFVIIFDSRAPKKDFKFLLEDRVKSQEFDVLEGKKLEAFAQKQMLEIDLRFDTHAMEYFLRYIKQFKEDRTWVLVNTLNQVSLARFGDFVTAQMLRDFLGWEERGELFSMALRFLGLRGMDRLVCLETMLSDGYAVSHVFNLLCAVAKKREDVFALAEIDEGVKGGVMDDEVGLTLFALDRTYAPPKPSIDKRVSTL